MTRPAPVIAIWLGNRAVDPAVALAAIRAAHPGAKLILMTVSGFPPALRALADEIWPDGGLRGASGFLARIRRLSWASASDIYDLEQSGTTRFLRFCVWPRPHWRNTPLSCGTGPLS